VRGQPKILVAEARQFSPAALAILQDLGDVRLADLDRAGLLAAVRGVDVVWVGLRTRIDGDLLASAPGLKCIVTNTTGVNHIDTLEATRRGVRVLSLRGEEAFLRSVRATAEHTIGLMLALMRRIPAATVHAADGGWDRDAFIGGELYGKRVGVIGYGRLGKLVTRYLRAFDADVVIADPHVTCRAYNDTPPRLDLNRLLGAADIVTVHVNLTSETTLLLGPEQFGLMRRGTWLVNTSRGEVIDEAALVKALLNEHLAGAALDVLQDEQNLGQREHPLRTYAREHDNLLLTPHVGGCTVESRLKTELFMANRLCQFVREELQECDMDPAQLSSFARR
jgi:D-3-phosphoglycerate dehydrogenase